MSKKNFILTSLILVVLFSFKDILLLASGGFSHLFPVVNTTRLTFEEVYCYIPFLNNLSISNLLSVNSTVLPLTIFIEWIIFKLFCFSNIDLYLFISHAFFPLCSFWLIFLIYKRYVSVPWATLLAFFGITFYNNFSMFPYIRQILMHPADIINSASLSPLEITRTPFPSFSFFIFLLCFYFSTLTYKISTKRYLLFTVFWSINIYIYLFNFIAGIIFWFSFMIFTQYVSVKPFSIKSLAKLLLLNTIIMVIVILPFLIKFYGNIGMYKDILQNLGFSSGHSGVIFNKWGIFFSYVLPLVLTLSVIKLYCADYYELFYRFTPVFILIATELVVLNLHIILGSFFQTHLFSIRIGNFFLPYLYYIPVIYFFSNPIKPIFHSRFKDRMSHIIHVFIKNTIIRYETIISILGITTVMFLVVASTLKYYDNHRNYVTPRMGIVYDRFKGLISVSKEEGTLVSEDIPVNLLLPVMSKSTSLFVNSFNTYMPKEEILERLILYAHIFKWESYRFLNFMMPYQAYESFYTKNDFVLSDAILNKGFGYWLLWHLRRMSVDELMLYRQRLLYKFENMDVKQALKKYKVTVIQAYSEINLSLPVELLKTGKDARLYQVNSN